MATFTLTEDHLKLLKNMYVGWQTGYDGAPEIDPKRPYGNSIMAYDVAEILEWQTDGGELSEEQFEAAHFLHKQTQTALQICLCTLSFVPGTYRKKKEYDDRSWELIS